MNTALGMLEYKTVASGITAADLMVKTAQVELVEAHTACPGKYLVLVSGEISAVNAAVEAARSFRPEHVLDWFVLGNPHESLVPAVYGCNEPGACNALGIVETYTAASAVVAADTAAKTAVVQLVELRLARGMCGKSYLLITGSVAAVEAACDKACADAAQKGLLADRSIIANPDPKLWRNIL